MTQGDKQVKQRGQNCTAVSHVLSNVVETWFLFGAHPPTCSLTHLLTHPHPPTLSPTHLRPHSHPPTLSHSLTHPLTHPLTHSLTH